MGKITIENIRTALHQKFLDDPKCQRCSQPKCLVALKPYKHWDYICDDCVQELKYLEQIEREAREREPRDVMRLERLPEKS